jgi:hypothetical protein
LGFKLLFAAISDSCAQVKISGYGVISCCIIWLIIREVEGGKEIQQGKAQRPRKKKGMKKAKPAKRSKAKTRAKSRPGSDGSPTASLAAPTWWRRPKINRPLRQAGTKTALGVSKAFSFVSSGHMDYRYSWECRVAAQPRLV